jgi:hypothetical protein
MLRYSITSSARASQGRWNFKAECHGGLEVDDQFNFHRPLDWQIGRLFAS